MSKSLVELFNDVITESASLQYHVGLDGLVTNERLSELEITEDDLIKAFKGLSLLVEKVTGSN